MAEIAVKAAREAGALVHRHAGPGSVTADNQPLSDEIGNAIRHQRRRLIEVTREFIR